MARPAWLEVFGVALRLGLTSFGGPIAHLGYFHKEYVDRRWVDEPTYTDLVALCQALPGPTSSQVGMAIGFTRAGFAGALAAWVGFTLPSALIMVAFGVLWVNQALVPSFGALVHGLGLVAVVVVAQAVWLMGRTVLAGKTPVRAAGLAAGVFLAQALVPSPLTPLLGLVASALAGFVAFRDHGFAPPHDKVHRPWGAIGALVVFGLLLVGLPWLRVLDTSGLVALTDALYRTGALVFGGGHVVLPLLQQELVAPGLVDSQAFLAGYGVAQAVPGPLFSLAAYLGFLVAGAPGAFLGLVALFLPSFLLVQGLVPFWQHLKAWGWFRRTLTGVHAGVVGLLAWAWYDPVCTTAVRGPLEVALVAILGVGLLVFRLPPWLVVLGGATAGLAFL